MAYGTNAPFGLQPRYFLNGSTWNDQTRQYDIASGYTPEIGGTPLPGLFIGDPVIRLSDGTIGIWPGLGSPGNPSAPILGVFFGCFYYDTNGTYVPSNYWPAGTVTRGAQNAKALIVDDPSVIFSAQVSTSAGNPSTAVGIQLKNLGCNISPGMGNNLGAAGNAFNPVTGPGGVYTPPANPLPSGANGGQSTFYLDFSEMSNTATYCLKLIDLEPNPAPGQQFYVAGPPTKGVFNNALVIINSHYYKGGTGTAGTGTVGV